MVTLIQRVRYARVSVEDQLVAQVGPGLLALIGVQPHDTQANADRLLQRILGYRVFADESGRMNLSLQQTGGDLLLVSQFTLVADTRKGARPSFSSAAPPELGRHLFDYLAEQACSAHTQVKTGRFGADMQVELCNDGPVTFWLEA